MSEAPAPDRSGLGGWMLAIGLGAVLTAAYSWVVTRGTFTFGDELLDWLALAWQFLLISGPLLFLALIGVRAWQAWAVALGFTLAFWGFLAVVAWRMIH